MNRKQALKIAMECIAGSMKPYTFGANRYKMDGNREPAAVRDYEKYTRYATALRIIEDEILGQGVLEI